MLSTLGSSRCREILQSPTLSGLSGLSKALARDKSLTTRIITFLFYFLLPSSLMIPLPSLLKLVRCWREGFVSSCHSRAVIFLGFRFDVIKITFGCSYLIPFARSFLALKSPLRRSERIRATAVSFLHQEIAPLDNDIQQTYQLK